MHFSLSTFSAYLPPFLLPFFGSFLIFVRYWFNTITFSHANLPVLVISCTGSVSSMAFLLPTVLCAIPYAHLILFYCLRSTAVCHLLVLFLFWLALPRYYHWFPLVLFLNCVLTAFLFLSSKIFHITSSYHHHTFTSTYVRYHLFFLLLLCTFFFAVAIFLFSHTALLPFLLLRFSHLADRRSLSYIDDDG